MPSAVAPPPPTLPSGFRDVSRYHHLSLLYSFHFSSCSQFAISYSLPFKTYFPIFIHALCPKYLPGLNFNYFSHWHHLKFRSRSNTLQFANQYSFCAFIKRRARGFT